MMAAASFARERSTMSEVLPSGQRMSSRSEGGGEQGSCAGGCCLASLRACHGRGTGRPSRANQYTNRAVVAYFDGAWSRTSAGAGVLLRAGRPFRVRAEPVASFSSATRQRSLRNLIPRATRHWRCSKPLGRRSIAIRKTPLVGPRDSRVVSAPRSLLSRYVRAFD